MLTIEAQILVNHMKRAKEEYTIAVNGLEALHKYRAEHESIKVIFMGMKPLSSAPVRVSADEMQVVQKFSGIFETFEYSEQFRTLSMFECQSLTTILSECSSRICDDGG